MEDIKGHLRLIQNITDGGKMAKKAFVNYDEENDILYASTRENVSDSLDFDNFVIDYSPTGKIVGVEIMRASKFAANFGIEKTLLNRIDQATISIIQGKEYALIKIAIFAAGKVSGELTVPSPVPQFVKI